MIDLYAAGTSNGMRARIALEECGLPYTFHPIALDKGEHKTAAFLAMNPNGQIPVIVDHDGPGGKPVTLSQSTAQLFKDRLRGFFQVWEDVLAKKTFCAADEVTVADLSLYAGYARVKGSAPELVDGLPNLARWAGEMAARPAMQRATKF